MVVNQLVGLSILFIVLLIMIAGTPNRRQEANKKWQF